MEILVSILVTMNQLPGEGPKRALAKSCVCVCVCVCVKSNCGNTC